MNKLSVIVSIGVIVGAPCLAHLAQAADASNSEKQGDLEEIVVTGMRKSVEESIMIKRDLDVISDAVSAEDIGQFPDINVAEALQRITGVQITRLSPDGTTADEGQYVSVRGLPTEFNYVSLNGEGVASASNSLINQTADRNFNFSVLSPDFISALEVYKTPTAALTEGGVAATINVKTLLPFDIGKRVFKGTIEGQSSSGENNPKANLSAIYSDIFADGRFGATLGYALNKREYLNTSVTDAQLDPQTINGKNYLVLDSNGVTETQNYYTTKTGYGAFQYRAADNLTFSLIALHAVTDDYEIQPGFTIRPQYASSYSDLVADPNGVLTTQIGNGTYYETQNFNTWNTNTLNNFTLKEEWHLGNWEVNSALDYSDSGTTSSQFGIDTLESGAFNIGPSYSGGYHVIGGDPIASFVLDPAFNPSNPNNYFFNYVGGNILDRSDIIRSARFDATYKLNDGFLRALKFGVRYQYEVNENNSVFEGDFSQGHASAAPYYTGSLLPPLSLNGYNGSAYVPLNFAFMNPQTYLNHFFGGSYNNWLNAATTKPSLDPSNQYIIGEKDTAVYVLGEYRFAWQIPVHGNVGVREVKTDQSVTDTSVNLNDITIIRPPPPPPAPSVIVPEGSRYTLSRTYYETLPSFNLTADLERDLLLRFAVAKVMSRPTLDQLVPRYSVSAGTTNTITGGNPNLDPFLAWQYDLSLEYYFAPGSMAAVAPFYKRVDSFIQTAHTPLVLQGITFDQQLPVNSSGGYVEGVEVNYTQLLSFLPSIWSGFGVQLNGTWAKGNEDADPAENIAEHPFQNLSTWTANASLFYDLHGVNVRLAYNYRSRYLFDPNVRGLGNTAAYGNQFSTLDLQAGYAITPHVTVFVEGNNLLQAPQIFTMQVTNSGVGSQVYPQTWINGDRRLAAGVRLSF